MKRFFGILVAVGVLLLGLAMYHFQASPQGLWRRLAGHLQKPGMRPTPRPVAQITPAPVSTPKASPAPELTAEATAPVAWIRQHRDRWPKEVALLQSVNFPAVVNGKIHGRIDVPPGTRVQIHEIEPEFVAVVHLGGGARVPIASTNLAALAQAAMEAEAKAAAAILPTSVLTVPNVSLVKPATEPVEKAGDAENGPDDFAVSALEFGKAPRKPGTFAHPGLIVTKKDIERIKSKVAAKAEPWYGAYLDLDKHAEIDHRLRWKPTMTFLTNDKKDHTNFTPFNIDVNSAYNNAIMWMITGKRGYAESAIEVLNTWNELTEINGSDKQLGAACSSFRLVNAAEIIRYTHAGWAPSDIRKFEAMLKRVFVPQIEMYGDRNWGTACIAAMMGIGIFCNDEKIYQSSLHAFARHKCCSLTKTIGPTGQNNESGRDQIHSQINIGHLAEASWVAWNQGVDLFSASHNRLLKGYEYMAKFMLWEEVSWDNDVQPCSMGPWSKISQINRGEFTDVYTPVYNHYVKRKGLAAPYTTRALETEGIEGLEESHLLGWKTLLLTLP